MKWALDQPFDWDGVSNIIVELCYDNAEVNQLQCRIRPLVTQVEELRVRLLLAE